MFARQDSSTPRRRHAYTLVEVLLVLTLVVILASLTMPLLDRPLANQRLKQAADRVRAEWTHARLKAMSTGETYVFRYVPNEGRYSIEAQMGPESSLYEMSAMEGAVLDGATAGDLSVQTVERALPEDCVFVESETGLDARADMVEDTAAPTSTLDIAWSSPIVFYPDGTTSDARLVIQNQYDHQIELSLRGLTGVVTVGDSITAGGPLP